MSDQLICYNGAHSTGFFRSLLGRDLNADSVSIARIAFMLRPPPSETLPTCVGVNGPALSSCSVAMARQQFSKLRAAAGASAE
eukprot:3518034-Pyramimonas_sp.AAC.1